MRRPDPYEDRARELCLAAGIDPDSRVGEGRGRPAWCDYRQAARSEHVAQEQSALAAASAQNLNAPEPIIVGNHDEGTIGQMRNCMSYGEAVAGVVCADGHLGYAQPVGGVIAYRDQYQYRESASILLAETWRCAWIPNSRRFRILSEQSLQILRRQSRSASGVPTKNEFDHDLFSSDLWKASDREDYKAKAQAQLGTVGSGNHYVDLMRDEDDYVWIGVHFASRDWSRNILSSPAARTA